MSVLEVIIMTMDACACTAAILNNVHTLTFIHEPPVWCYMPLPLQVTHELLTSEQLPILFRTIVFTDDLIYPGLRGTLW